MMERGSFLTFKTQKIHIDNNINRGNLKINNLSLADNTN